jgi:hypothetical protein
MPPTLLVDGNEVGKLEDVALPLGFGTDAAVVVPASFSASVPGGVLIGLGTDLAPAWGRHSPSMNILGYWSQKSFENFHKRDGVLNWERYGCPELRPYFLPELFAKRYANRWT